MRRILPKHVGSPVIPMNREICWTQIIFVLLFYQTLIHQMLRKFWSFIGTPQTHFIIFIKSKARWEQRKTVNSIYMLTGSAS